MPVAPRYRFGEDPFFKQQMAADASSWERKEREKAARQDALWGMVGGVFDFYQKGSMPKMDPTGSGGGGGDTTYRMSAGGGGGGGGNTGPVRDPEDAWFQPLPLPATSHEQRGPGYPGVLGSSSGQQATGAQPGTPAAPATPGYPGVLGGSSGQRPAAAPQSTSMRGAGNDESALRQQALAQLMLRRDEKQKPQWYDYLG